MFIRGPPVEAFYEIVIYWFSGPIVFQVNTMLLRPFVQGVACELGPVTVRNLPGRRPCSRRRSNTFTTRRLKAIYPLPVPGLELSDPKDLGRSGWGDVSLTSGYP